MSDDREKVASDYSRISLKIFSKLLNDRPLMTAVNVLFLILQDEHFREETPEIASAQLKKRKNSRTNKVNGVY